MYFKMSSATCFNLDQFKVLSSGNWLNTLSQSQVLITLQKKAFENVVGKGEKEKFHLEHI